MLRLPIDSSRGFSTLQSSSDKKTVIVSLPNAKYWATSIAEADPFEFCFLPLQSKKDDSLLVSVEDALAGEHVIFIVAARMANDVAQSAAVAMALSKAPLASFKVVIIDAPILEHRVKPGGISLAGFYMDMLQNCAKDVIWLNPPPVRSVQTLDCFGPVLQHACDGMKANNKDSHFVFLFWEEWMFNRYAPLVKDGKAFWIGEDIDLDGTKKTCIRNSLGEYSGAYDTTNHAVLILNSVADRADANCAINSARRMGPVSLVILHGDGVYEETGLDGVKAVYTTGASFYGERFDIFRWLATQLGAPRKSSYLLDFQISLVMEEHEEVDEKILHKAVEFFFNAHIEKFAEDGSTEIWHKVLGRLPRSIIDAAYSKTPFYPVRTRTIFARVSGGTFCSGLSEIWQDATSTLNKILTAVSYDPAESRWKFAISVCKGVEKFGRAPNANASERWLKTNGDPRSTTVFRPWDGDMLDGFGWGDGDQLGQTGIVLIAARRGAGEFCIGWRMLEMRKIIDPKLLEETTEVYSGGLMISEDNLATVNAFNNMAMDRNTEITMTIALIIDDLIAQFS